MNETPESDELLARLRAADPASRAVTPAPTWIDDLTEATMSTTTENRTRRTWVLAAAAAVVVAVIGGFFALGGGDDNKPEANTPGPVFELAAPGATDARCMVVTPKALARSESAFEATVTSLEGREATLKIEKWYAGTDDAQRSTRAHLTSATQSMNELIGSVQFKVGNRYLISANDGVMTACGFSAAWSQGLEDKYVAAFGS